MPFRKEINQPENKTSRPNQITGRRLNWRAALYLKASELIPTGKLGDYAAVFPAVTTLVSGAAASYDSYAAQPNIAIVAANKIPKPTLGITNSSNSAAIEANVQTDNTIPEQLLKQLKKIDPGAAIITNKPISKAEVDETDLGITNKYHIQLYEIEADGMRQLAVVAFKASDKPSDEKLAGFTLVNPADPQCPLATTVDVYIRDGTTKLGVDLDFDKAALHEPDALSDPMVAEITVGHGGMRLPIELGRP